MAKIKFFDEFLFLRAHLFFPGCKGNHLVISQNPGHRIRITAIETLVCHARMRNWIFVKVVTNQPGLVGWGEATLEWHTRGVVGAIEDLTELLIGEDPTAIEYLWQKTKLFAS